MLARAAAVGSGAGIFRLTLVDKQIAYEIFFIPPFLCEYI